MTHELEFASHPGNLGLVRDFARYFLKTLPFKEEEIDLMVLGLDEACANVIRHAYESRCDGLIRLTCATSGGAAELRLRDFGRPCDTAKLQGRALDEVRPGGLGLHLMRSAFTDVEYRPDAEGTELILRRTLPAA